MTKATTPLKQTAHTARNAAAQPWVEQLTRLGYLVRGALYILLGILAIQIMLGRTSNQPTPNGVIEMIGATPYGKGLLLIAAVGLLGMTFWGFIRAAFDPLHRGNDADGLAQRLGFIASAVGYGMLLVATVQYLLGATMNAGNPQDWSAKLLAQPFGRVLVGVIGLGWLLGGGLWQIYSGWKTDFKKDLKMRQMSAREKQIMIGAGKIGYIARGIVFGLIGLFLILAAVQANPSQAKGFDGALLALSEQPYGQVLLGIVALGLIAFGIYSMLDAFWMRLRVHPRSQS